MIVDKLANLRLYAALNPLFGDVCDFMSRNDLRKIENGKHIIKGENLFANVEDDKGKSKDEAVFEYHRKKIDIQIPLNIPETYGYTPVEELPPADFNVEKDIAKVSGVTPRNFITITPGEFVIFFPQDGHAPCIADGVIHKAVFKVATDLR